MSNQWRYKKGKKQNERIDHAPGHRMEYERNRKKILLSQDICGICGKPVDKTLKYPDPWSATVDHIIPVSRGGHPTSMSNLQLAHFRCNRLKSDKIKDEPEKTKDNAPTLNLNTDPRGLPLVIDWARLNGSDVDDPRSNFNKLYDEAEQIRAKGFIVTSHGITRPLT